MKNRIYDKLIERCIEYYKKVCKSEDSFYGTPPQSIIIAIGMSNNSEWKELSQKEAVYRYTSECLQEVSNDTDYDRTENGMYFKEAYAELSFNSNNEAFMMMIFGKRYARCYRYSIRTENDDINLTDEKLIWVS